MEQVVLTAQIKEESGKGIARKLRQQGLIPAVLYGGAGKNSNLSLSLNYKDVLNILKSDMGMGTISQLEIQGLKEKRNVIFREIQLHPIRRDVLHVDLYEVAMDKVIQVEVPIELTGQAVGVKDQGGILEQHLRSLNIESLPGKIPGHIDVDISPLDLGKSIHVEDLKLPDGVKVLDNPELLVASVVEPSKVEAPVVEEAEAEAAEGEAAPAEESATDKS